MALKILAFNTVGVYIIKWNNLRSTENSIEEYIFTVFQANVLPM